MKHDLQVLSVNATDANQRFSRLLAESEHGRDVVITKRGRPVARLMPINGNAEPAAPIGAPAASDIPDFDKRSAMIEVCRRMNRTGLNQGTSGNASTRVDGGLLITPSGLDYEQTMPADIVKIGITGRLLHGHRRPSSEWHFHCRVMEARPRAGALLHTHSVNATALACLGRGIPPFHYMVAVAGGTDIRCAPYATFGTEELADAVVAALDGRLACLMANHGMIVLGRDIEDAYNRAVEVETLAAQYLKALAVGEPNLLHSGQMDAVLEKFRNYSGWAAANRM